MSEYEQMNGKGIIVKDAESIFANAAAKSFLGNNSQLFVVFSGTGAVDDAGFSFEIPADYAGGLRFHYIWTMDATGLGTGRIAINLIQATDLNKTFIDAIDETLEILDDGQDGTAWLTQKSPSVSSALNWLPGDICIVELEREPGHVDDDMSDTLFMSYFVIEYDK